MRKLLYEDRKQEAHARKVMVNKLYAIFYKTSITRHWRYYGAFTTLEMAQDLTEHIKRRPRDRAIETRIEMFALAEEQEKSK